MTTEQSFITGFIDMMKTLTATSNETERLLDRWLREGNHPNTTQLLILHTIQTGTQYPTALAELLGQPAPSMSQNTKILLDNAYITTERDPSDGRRRKLILTQEGAHALQAATTHLETQLTRARITDDTITPTRITNALDKLRKRVLPQIN